MEYLLIWVACGLLAFLIALIRGGAGCVWFFLGLLLGPVGVILILFTKIYRCPQCRKRVNRYTAICPHCKYNIQTGQPAARNIVAEETFEDDEYIDEYEEEEFEERDEHDDEAEDEFNRI